MTVNTILSGNNTDTLKTLPDNSVDCCVTSPPYYGLRDYGVEGQIGLEEMPEEYIQKLVDVFREVWRVLRNDGTLWVNIGDSYAGSGKGGATHPENAKKYIQGTNRGLIGKTATTKVKWGNCKPKDLIGIPWMLAFALRADGWYLRQDIIWHKPNPMPEPVTDRCTKAHEYLFLFSKSPKYYFDNTAIKEPVAEVSLKRAEYRWECDRPSTKNASLGGAGIHVNKMGARFVNPEGRNKRDVWTIATSQCRDAHFATFPPDLIIPCIKAGSRCGGVVLDPFLGSGTTAVVAMKLLRKFIGCELNPEYIKIAERRIKGEWGLFDD